MCPCVRASVRPSLRKSAVTFEPLDGSARNFQGPLNSSQLIFGRVTRTPGPAGSGPDPEKAGFRQIYLLRGFWGRGSCRTFSESGRRGEQNVGSGILSFGPALGFQPNFQGRLNSSQVIFGRVTWTPGPSGAGPDPKKAGFRQIYLLRGFWGRGVVSPFRNWDNEANRTLGAEF